MVIFDFSYSFFDGNLNQYNWLSLRPNFFALNKTLSYPDSR